MKLFKRKVRIVVSRAGDNKAIEITNLDIAFRVKKELIPKPNVADIRIWNLNKEHRKYLETAHTLRVELYAGYEDGQSLLYSGELSSATTYKDGKDFITRMKSGDKQGIMGRRVLRVGFGPQTTVGQALQILAKEFGDDTGQKGRIKYIGVGRGNIDAIMPSGAAQKVLFPHGGVLSGSAAQAMTAVCRSAGLEWSIIDGQLQVLNQNAALEKTAILLGPETGLLGSIGVKTDGFIQANCLLIPDLRPGRKVVFDTSTALTGGYRIWSCEYNGDTQDSEWSAKLELRSYTKGDGLPGSLFSK